MNAPATRHDLVTLPIVYLICAFRYALGRQTYIVGMVADELISNVDRLQEWQREQIVRDIRSAIELRNAGADMDIRRWHEVAEVMEGAPPPARPEPDLRDVRPILDVCREVDQGGGEDPRRRWLTTGRIRELLGEEVT